MQPSEKDRNQWEQWNKNQGEKLTSEGFVELTYTINDPDAEASAASEHTHRLSERSMPEGFNPPLLDETERRVTPLATLEQDLWLLNGTKVTASNIDEENGYTGFISRELCDERGNFKDNPRIQIDLKDTVSILPGLIMTWSTAFGDYPTEFKIISYSNNQQESKTVSDNTDTVSTVIFEMTNIDRIDVEVLKWSTSHRRARIERIFLGLQKTYTKNNLLGFATSQSIDVLSASLPKYDVSFEVDNRDGNFDPLNPEGLSKYMIERQEISTRYGFKLDDEIQWIPGGVYYLSDWSAPQNGMSASFRARDLLGFLNRTYHKGRFKNAGISLYELAERVLEEANLPQRRTDTGTNKSPWELDEVLKSVRTTAPLPICTLGECLQLIANAGCCAIFFDRDGILYIKRLIDGTHAIVEPKEEDGVEEALLNINDDNSYTRPEISLTKPVKQVDVSMYSFTTETERTDIYEGTLLLETGENEFIIEYSDFAENIDEMIDEVRFSDGRAANSAGVMVLRGDGNTKFFAKSCKLVLLSTHAELVSCRVVLSGNVRRSSETIITTQVASQHSGETQPLENPLITNIGHAREVGEWLRDNLTRRKHLSLDWRADPRIDAGDIVTVGNIEEIVCADTGNILVEGRDGDEVRIVSSSFSFSGAFKGKVEGVVIA